MSQEAAQLEKKKRFGEWLVAKGLIDQHSQAKVLREQLENGGHFGEALLSLNLLTDDQVATALGEFLSIDYVSLDDVSDIDMRVARKIPESIAERFNLVATGRKEGRIVVAMTDPLDLVALDIVASKTRGEIRPVISTRRNIEKARDAVYHGSYIEEEHLRDLVETEVAREDEEIPPLDSVLEDLVEANISGEEAAGKAPVIQFVNLLLGQAIKSRASDIHIEPQEHSMDVRMRVDGVLRSMVPPPRKMQSGVITRIKILSQMDIAERRLPQDGRFKIKAPGREIDVRVSAIPVIYGEKIVMRILDKAAVDHDLDILGFEPDLLEKLKATLHQPHGIVIVTGPTGSGKSTTLYSALNYLRDPRKNITTVEDPIEYRLKGINQIQVKPEIDLDFAVSLRAILRQDPDIILIGEIRDRETVEIAIKASLTGHLVLSTFHTNDAASALTRLAYMGVDRYLLASTLNLVIAQRLVRRICQRCKEPVALDEQTLKHLKIDVQMSEDARFSRGKGCGACGDAGFLGRLAIFEFLIMTPEIREAVIAGESEAKIRAMSKANGYGGLIDSGARKVIEGVTTAEEVINTTFAENIA